MSLRWLLFWRVLFQLVVIVYDSANPQQKARAQLVLAVRRNENTPVFTQSLYEKEISENFPLGEEIVKVAATDGDVVCSHRRFVNLQRH